MTPRRVFAACWTCLAVVGLAAVARAQADAPANDGIERPGPPALENFETDKNRDGVPDGGWYNLRDVSIAPRGGVPGHGAHCLRFEVPSDKPGRQARISRAFGVNGKENEAIVIGLWVRQENIVPGERVGDDPSLMIDFLGPQLRTLGRGMLGPWTHSIGSEWTFVSKRIEVPPGTLDAIITVGLLGATGVLEVDGISFDLIDAGGKRTPNLLLNGDFELGDPDPWNWTVSNGATRAFPGQRSASALELKRSGARAMNSLGVMVDRLPALEILLTASADGLRGAGGAQSAIFFLDGNGRELPGLETGVPLFAWGGSFDWRPYRTIVPVPQGAVHAVLQIEKEDPLGVLQLDNIKVMANPDPVAGTWTPYHVQTDTTGWLAVEPTPSIEPKSALDTSFLVPEPAGQRGFVTVTREGRLAFSKGGRARFFGVAFLAPAAFQEAEQTDALVDRLARSGINLVRLGDLDTPFGPGRSLLDDTRDDTKALDPLALERLDHLIAALKAHGIYVALELLSDRRFRAGDEVEGYRTLPMGGGPAAGFDPKVRQRVLETAKQLLTHVNPETNLALRDDPVLAWVTISGEQTLFDLIEKPGLLPPESAQSLKTLSQKHTASSARKFWQATESNQWKEIAGSLRGLKVRAPIAGVSHWRREPAEFNASLVAQGLDLIDDRLFYAAPAMALPERRALVQSLSGGLAGLAARKRHPDKPYVVGQWCNMTDGAWATQYEAADQLLAAVTAMNEDWDGLVRRGVFIFPEVWGANATGTGGGEDFFTLSEAINGIPQAYALLPHCASIVLRGQGKATRTHLGPRPAANRRSAIPGWDPQVGRLVIDTPYTQGLAGWAEGIPATFETLGFDLDNPYGVVVATSMTNEPLATSKRLLVTAIARVEPTGMRYVDQWQRDVADPGRAPLLMEPVRAKVVWKPGKGGIKAYELDPTGARANPVKLEKSGDGVRLEIDGKSPTVHWELVIE